MIRTLKLLVILYWKLSISSVACLHKTKISKVRKILSKLNIFWKSKVNGISNKKIRNQRLPIQLLTELKAIKNQSQENLLL